MFWNSLGTQIRNPSGSSLAVVLWQNCFNLLSLTIIRLRINNFFVNFECQRYRNWRKKYANYKKKKKKIVALLRKWNIEPICFLSSSFWQVLHDITMLYHCIIFRLWRWYFWSYFYFARSKMQIRRNNLQIGRKSLFFFILWCSWSLFLADPGEARGCSTNTSVTRSLINSSFSSHNFTALPCPNG